MTEVVPPVEHGEPRTPEAERRYRLLQASLLGLRAGPALILLLLVVIVSLTTPVFFTSRNIGNVFSQTAVIAVLALGQLLVILSRGIDLSVGATVALSGVVGAIVYMHVHSTVLVMLAVLGIGLAVGLVQRARLRARTDPAPVHRHAREPQHRARARAVGGARDVDPGHAGRGRHARRRLDRLAALLVLRRRSGSPSSRSSLTTYLVWGRWLYAVGGNPDAARRAGIPVGRVLVTVYAISGLAAGVGGLLTAGLIDSGSPTAGDLAELDSIAAVIIGGAAFAGGRGNVGNALVGRSRSA